MGYTCITEDCFNPVENQDLGLCASCNMDNKWISVNQELPKEDYLVDCLIADGRIVELKRKGRLWFVPDGSMYVYYTPTHWKKES